MIMAIIGISGRMGHRLYDYYKNRFEIIGIDVINCSDVKTYKHLSDVEEKIDVVVDFSNVEALDELTYAVDNKILTLSGTTGYSDEIIDKLKEKGNGLFYWSANYSKGIDLFSRLISIIKDEYSLFDFIEISSHAVPL